MLIVLWGVPTATTLAEMNAVTTAAAGSIVYNLEDLRIYVFNGTIWVSTNNDNWLVNGNIGLPDTSFLGHIDDVPMEIRSNNLPLLQFGRRQTLGLTTGLADYNDNDQPLVNINGNGTTAALQFAGAGTAYPPLFFSTPDGNFRIRGGAGTNDLFFLGSLNNGTDAEFEIVVGDDGAEAITFKNFNFRNGGEITEFMRIQGNANQASPLPRVGIGTSGNQANSTFQVNGSVALDIITTSGNITLNENHHTVVISGNHTITLPAANAVTGRIYVLRNSTGSATNVSNYSDLSNTNQTTVPANTVIWLQSNGANWQLINNISAGGGGGGSSTTTYVDKYNTTDTDISVNGFNNNGFQIPLNTARFSAGSVNNVTNNQVQITEAGLYEVSYTVSVIKDENANRPSFEVVVSQNSNPIADTGAIFSIPGANNANRYATASRKMILNLSANQSYGIKIRGFNSNATIDITIIGQGTGMTIKRL